MARWPGMNWLAHCVPDRDPDAGGVAAGETGEPSALSYKPTMPCAHSMA